MYQLFEYIIDNKRSIRRTLSLCSLLVIVVIIIAQIYHNEVKARVEYLDSTNKRLLELQAANASTIVQLKKVSSLEGQYPQNNSDPQTDNTNQGTDESVEVIEKLYNFEDTNPKPSFATIATDIFFPLYYLIGFNLEQPVTVSQVTYTYVDRPQKNDYLITATFSKENIIIETKQGGIATGDACTEQYNIETPLSSAHVCVYQEDKAVQSSYTVTIENSSVTTPSGNTLKYIFVFNGNYTQEQVQNLFNLLEST